MGFMRWCNVVVVLNAMPIFVFFNNLVIFLIFGLWKVNVVQILLSFLLVFLLPTLCSICRLSFSSKCCGTLLFFQRFIEHCSRQSKGECVSADRPKYDLREEAEI